MSIDWEEVSLEDVAEEITVGHVGPMADRYVSAGFPFLRSLNIEPYRINTSDLKFIDQTFHRSLRKSALRPGDVVIVRTGKPGTCAVIPEWLGEANCSDVVIVRCGSDLLPQYLSYVINSVAAHHISSHTVGAVQQHFNVGSARTLRLRLPSLPDQERLLTILGALDDKIELNLRMNKTLEAMARALFQDWFVDFGPVRAKVEGRDLPGLAPEVFALFPSRFNDDGHPDGWKREPLLSHARLLSGGTPKTEVAAYWNGPIAWASAKDVSQCRDAFLIATERTISDRGLAESTTQIIPKLATVIVARGATTGRHCMFGRDMAMNQTCYALASIRSQPYFVHCAFKSLAEELVSAAHGSVFDTITTVTFNRTSIILPPEKLIAVFEETLTPIFQRLLSNVEEAHTLATLRDLLLPKLMSGVLRPRDAERLVGESA